MMKKNEWYQAQHNREKKTLEEVLRKIGKGVFWIVNVRMDKDLIGSGWRLTVFLRERDK